MAFWGKERKGNAMLKDSLNKAGDVAKWAFRPAMSALLAFTMAFGSIPAPAYAEMIDTAAHAIAVAQAEEEKKVAESTADAAPDAANADTPSNSGAPEDVASAEAGAAPIEADLTTDGDLTAAQLSGDAVASPEAARAALSAVEGADPEKAIEAADVILADMQDTSTPAPSAEGELHNEADGSKIGAVKLRWITEDTPSMKEDDDNKLSLRPTATNFTVTMRVSYSLSGQRDYDPGEVFITIPADMFKDRDGKTMGTYRFPVPQEPATSGTWNYKLVDGNYVLTNTRRLSAATNGYVEFSISNLPAVEFVDMFENGPYQAAVSAITHKENVIELASDPLTMVVDTKAELIAATKVGAGVVKSVAREDAPEAAREKWPNISEFVVVNWMTDCTVEANQPYTLEVKDELQFVTEEGKPMKEKGLLIPREGEGELSEDGSTFTHSFAESSRSGRVGALYFKSVYPKEWFEHLDEKTYRFENKVTYTLTEADPERGDDEQLVTERSQTASDFWTRPVPPAPNPDKPGGGTGGGGGGGGGGSIVQPWQPGWVEPDSNITMYKNGNNGPKDNYRMQSVSYDGSMSDLSSYDSMCYGSYADALNLLAGGNDVLISYSLKARGDLMPWTYEDPKNPKPGSKPEFMIENYGKHEVELVTEDPGLTTAAGALEVNRDYAYDSIMFSREPVVYKATPVNLTEDGQIKPGATDDAHFSFTVDEKAEAPNVDIVVKIDGEWKTFATASWPEGKFKVDFEKGFTRGKQDAKAADEGTVKLPEGTQAVRLVTKTNVPRIYIYARVNFTLKGDGYLHELAEQKLEGSSGPTTYVYNDASVVALNEEGKELDYSARRAYDRLLGYSAETRVHAEKSWPGELDVDKGAETITAQFTAKVHEQTFISDIKVYQDLVDQGIIEPNTGGVWYDLLPKGMVPLLNTVQVRSGDRIRDMYTIENYKNTGRTLLVVSVALTPSLQEYAFNDLSFYEDIPTLSYSARISFEDWKLYSSESGSVHNVIAFESDKDVFGTTKGSQGEKNDPRGTNNVETGRAFYDESDAIKDAMSGLALAGTKPRTTPSFVYAGVSRSYEFGSEASGEGELYKKVMVNGDGLWSDGLKDHPRDVYAGGAYGYRLTYEVAAGVGRNMVFYDSLETFEAKDGNEDEDINKPTWKGVFKSIDVSALERLGCAPEVYISKVPNLKFEEKNEEGLGEEITQNTDLANKDMWEKVDIDKLNALRFDERAEIKAIAVDASKTPEGGQFLLPEKKLAAVEISMQAPRGEEAKTLIGQDAHAYNNAFLKMDLNVEPESEEFWQNGMWIRKDYTKVGIKQFDLNVVKRFDDEDDRDGKRPVQVTLQLTANGEPVDGATATLPQAGATGDDAWKCTFTDLDYLDEEGEKIVYSVREKKGTESGYTPNIAFDGSTFTMTNHYKPVRISKRGQKTWEGDVEGNRPASIKVRLYADGKLSQTKTVYPDTEGNWYYDFTNLYKYRDGGEEIKYTIQEDPSSAPSYIPNVDGMNIINKYHPYGDLRITKTVDGVTDANESKEFPFTIQFFQGDRPMLDEFKYTIVEGGEQTGESGTVATGGTITLKQGQSAVIEEIPEGWNYKIEENLEGLSGFTQGKVSGAEGTIAPNAEQHAQFQNVYRASAQVNLQATKRLMGAELRTYQFTFEVYDEEGNLLRTAMNGPVDKEGSGHDVAGNILNIAPVTFGAFEYTQEDDGETFTYQIKEKVRDAKGFTYDTVTRYADVTVRDNGDGTMSPTVKYRNNQNAPQVTNPPRFENRYEAKGSVQLQAHKTLKGGELEDGQFTFTLSEYSEKWGPQTENAISTVKNKADGTVEFDTLEFTQKDIGTSKIYVILETPGAIKDMAYDGHMALVRVNVSDNRDGTLAIDTIFDVEVSCYKCKGTGTVGAAKCPLCDGAGRITSTADDLEFVNNYGAGDLVIKKQLEEGAKTDDPNHVFKFRLELTNEEGEPVDNLDMSTGELVKSDSAAKQGERDNAFDPIAFLGDAAQAAGGFFLSLVTPEEAAAAELPEGVENEWTSADGSWGWTFYTDGTLLMNGDIGKAGGTAPEELIGVLVDAPGKSGAGARVKVLKFAEGSTTSKTVLSEGPWRWMDFQSNSAGELVPSESTVAFPNLEIVDLSNLSFTYENINASEAFGEIGGASSGGAVQRKKAACAAQKVVFPSDQTLNLNTASGMFNGCGRLAEIENLSCLKTDNCVSMSRMFAGTSLKQIDASEFVTSNCTDISFMFSKSDKLTDVKLPKILDVKKVTNMERMFEYCSRLTNVVSPETVTGGRTSEEEQVKTVHGMFYDCKNLQAIDVSFIGKIGTDDIHNMFTGCYSLTTVKLPNLLLSYNGCMDIGGLFKNCVSLESVDLSPLFGGLDDATWWDEDYILVNIAEAFQGSSALSAISFPSEKKIKINKSYSSMRDVFNGCTALKQIDLTGFITYEKDWLGNEEYGIDTDAFKDCTSLRKLTVPNSTFKFTEDCGLTESLPSLQQWGMLLPDGTMDPSAELKTTVELVEGHPFSDSSDTATYVRSNKLTLIYNLVNGVGSVSDQSFLEGAEVRLTQATPVRFGHKFLGWSEYFNGSKPLYQPGQVIPADVAQEWLDDSYQGKKHLYAAWEEDAGFRVDEGVYEFEIPAGYELHLEEIIPSGTRYKVSELTEAGWKLVASSGVAGTVEHDAPQQATFTNAPLSEGEPQTVQASFEAEKLLDGKYAGAGEFEFRAVACSEAGVPQEDATPIEGELHDGGMVMFPAQPFDAAGTYYFLMTEVGGTDSNIVYDDSSYLVRVEVTAAEEGTLSADVTYWLDGEKLETVPQFKNVHTPGSLKIEKRVTGLPGGATTSDQTFSFMVKINNKPYVGPYAVDGNPFNTVDGRIELLAGKSALIEGLAPGSSYSVEEVDIPNGWTLSDGPQNAQGAIQIGATAQVAFTNKYDATGVAQLAVYKSFPDGGLKDGAFTFALYEGWTGTYPDSDAKPLSTASNGLVDTSETMPNPDGSDTDVPNPYVGMAPAYFADIEYGVGDVGKTYDYTILEVVPGGAINDEGVTYAEATSEQKLAGGFKSEGVEYDTTLRHAQVTVRDNGDGTLKTEVTYEKADGASSDVFVNHPLDVDLVISKRVTNTDLSEAAAKTKFKFTLGLKDSAGEPLKDQSYRVKAANGDQGEEQKISDGGTIELMAGELAEFDGLPYGTQYTVEEQQAPGWTMTGHTGELSGTLTGEGGPVEVEIVNTYNATGSIAFKGRKEFKGGDLKEGQFYFELHSGDGEYLGQTTNWANGDFEFKPIVYTLDDLKAANTSMFTYRVLESPGGDSNISYDDTVYEIQVTVTDQGNGTLKCEAVYRDGGLNPVDEIVFTNHKAVRLAFTGGEGIGMLGIVIVALGCAAYLIDRKRRGRA